MPDADNSNRPPLVSVIMSMLNSADTVAAAVRSVLQQSLADFELIVIDNGSSDQSSAIVAAFADPRIRLVREASTSYLGARLKQAAALCRGEFIARMDADDICFPARLATQVARLREDPSLDLIGCGAVVFSSDGELLGELPVPSAHDDIVSQPFIGFPLPHPTWCGRATWFRNNPYDAEISYAEDQDLLLRSYRRTRFGSVDAVLLAYRQDRLALNKLLEGRRAFIGSLCRHALGRDPIVPVLTGLANHVVKGAVDVATVGLGFNRSMQRLRLKPVPSDVLPAWVELKRHLQVSALDNTVSSEQSIASEPCDHSSTA